MVNNTCPYKAVIDCPEDGRHCETCGWSPEVDKRRREAKPGEKAGLFRHKLPYKTLGRKVAKLDPNGRVIETYESENEAALRNNISRTVVRSRCTGRTKIAALNLGGCTFCYID